MNEYRHGSHSVFEIHLHLVWVTKFRGRHPWARGDFCWSTGDVTDEVVAEYIANQGESGPGDFRVEHGDF